MLQFSRVAEQLVVASAARQERSITEIGDRVSQRHLVAPEMDLPARAPARVVPRRGTWNCGIVVLVVRETAWK
jgi:hypothetical protein